MQTQTLTNCPNCNYPKALWHYSSDNIVNWKACPKCKHYFEHDKHITTHNFSSQSQENAFWKYVEIDTAYTTPQETK